MDIKNKVIDLREQGKTYREIAKELNVDYSENVRKKWSKWCKQPETNEIEGMQVRRAWQLPNGEMRYSYERTKVDLNSDEFISKMCESLNKLEIKSPTYEKTKENKIFVLPLPDLHFGKDFLHTLVQRLNEAVYTLVENAKGVEKIVVPILGDIFNVDNSFYTTTKGTPQQQKATWQDSFVAGYTSICEILLSLQEIAPVDVIVINGNHDYATAWYFGHVLRAYFKDVESIHISVPNTTRTYYQYEKVGIMLNHGEIKTNKYPEIFAAESPKIWGTSEHREVLLGHVHHSKVQQYAGVTVRYLPTICGTDTWHYDNGYISEKALQSFIYDGEKGLIQINQINF